MQGQLWELFYHSSLATFSTIQVGQHDAPFGFGDILGHLAVEASLFCNILAKAELLMWPKTSNTCDVRICVGDFDYVLCCMSCMLHMSYVVTPQSHVGSSCVANRP